MSTVQESGTTTTMTAYGRFRSNWPRIPAAQSAVVFLLFLLIAALTEPAYLADTARYANDIARHRAGAYVPGADPFWDFGHVAWRPLMNAIFGLFGPTVERVRGSNPYTALVWLMISVNLVCGVGSALALRPVLARFSTDRAALLGTFAFLCTNAMLDYTRSGSSYVPALAALNVSLFLICKCPDQPNDPAPSAWLAGISMAASILFWFPFILAVPATGLFIVVVSRRLPRPRRVRLFFTIFAACGIAVILVYGAAIHARGIRSFPALKSWVDASKNEWAQTDRVKRAISGVPRSVLDLGDDTLAMKRYVYRDPYAPVTVSQLLRAGMAKLLLFYLYVAAILLVLSRGPDGRTVLKLLITSAVPTLVFAVALFEPGSTERYLPVYPFFFLAAALALGSVKPPSTPVRLFMGAFLVVVLCAGNLYAKLSFRGAATYTAFLERKQALEATASPGDMIAVLSFWDPLYRLPALRLLDDRAQLNYQVYDIIETASGRVLRWRQQFADRTLKQWASGRHVFLSRRVLADRPLPEWKWVEGDTSKVAWPDIVSFFRGFEIGPPAGGPTDGFSRLEHSARNEKELRRWSKGQP